MNLGALVGLGVDFGYLCAELEKLNLAGEFKLERKNVLKNGIAATKIDVVPLKSQPHARSYADIKQILEGSNLSKRCKQRAGAIFRTIAQAEAKVHGTQIDRVHFHELGAIDSIVDIAGAAICLEYLFENLGVSRVLSSKIELGGGVAICDHGALSVPAPAVCEILRGVPVSLGRANFEMTTPTGAAILKACADEFTDSASFRIEKIGKAGERFFKQTRQPIKLTVDGNPQGLKGLGCRMYGAMPKTNGNSIEHGFAQLLRFRKGCFLPCFHDSAGNRPGKPLFGK